MFISIIPVVAIAVAEHPVIVQCALILPVRERRIRRYTPGLAYFDQSELRYQVIIKSGHEGKLVRSSSRRFE
jgi:hypothetical protein